MLEGKSVTIVLNNGKHVSHSLEKLSHYAVKTLRDLKLVPELLKHGKAHRGSITYILC